MKIYPLRRMLFSGVIICVILSGVVLGWFSFRVSRDHLIEQGINSVQGYTYMIEQVLSEYHREASQDEYQGIVESLTEGTSIRITIIDSSGNVIADSSRHPSQMDNHSDRIEVKGAIDGTAQSEVRFSDSLNYDMIYYAIPFEFLGDSGVLRTSLPLTELKSSLNDIYRYFSIGIVLLLTIVLFFMYLLLLKIERPMASLAKKAKLLSQMEFDVSANEPSSIKEIHIVSESLHAMAREMQRQFGSMQHQRDELKAVFDSMSEAVFVLDENLTVLEANPSANTFFQKKQKELTSLPIQSVIKSPDLYELIKKTAEDGVRRSAKITVKRSCYHVNITSLPGFYGFDSSQVVLVCNDITTLMHLEQVRRDFVANVSHELKTPITSIKGFSETLLETDFNDLDRTRRFLQIINRQSLRLQAIIDDLLTLSQLEQTQDRNKSAQPVYLLPIIEDAVIICREKTQQTDRIFEIACDASVTVRGNSHLIEQALINVIENAMKYSDQASSISIVCASENSAITLSVIDKGYGIPEHDIPRIFERFYRVDKARSRDKGGTGLGLSIVKHIMLQHQGNITVESKEGEGSAFSLHFPQ